MRFLPRRRISIIATAVVLALIATVLVVAAVRADGYQPVDLNLNDAGVWVTNGQISDVGRVNTEIHLVDTKLEVPSPAFDVLQSGADVLVDEPGNQKLVQINVSTAVYANSTNLPIGAQVGLGNQTGAVLAGSKLWVASAAAIAAENFTTAAPSATVPGATAVTVDVDGDVDVLSEAGAIHEFGPTGQGIGTAALSAHGTAFQLTTVGKVPVALDPSRDEVLLPGGAAVPLGAYGRHPQLQQAGPEATAVLVATDDDLVSVPLHGGRPTVLWSKGGGKPAQPVWLGSCAYGAWQAHDRYARVCSGTPTQSGVQPAANPADTLRYRVNRGRAVLNDLDTGANLVFGTGQPTTADDWSQAEQVVTKSTTSKVNPQPSPGQKQINLDGADRPPVAVDIHAETRPGRPVVIHPLDSDSDPDGDVLVINPLKALRGGEGTAATIDDGQDIQYTPAPGQTSAATFAYTITDGRGGTASANIDVDIVPVGQNSPPTTVAQSLVDAEGVAASTNVAVKDSDPEGDAFLVTAAKADQGQVQWADTGQITYTPPGGFIGTATVTYTLTDEYGASSNGTLSIDVRPTAGLTPSAANAHATVLAGQTASVDLSQDASDPSGNAVLLTNVTHLPAGATVTWTPAGIVHFTDATAGSYEMLYQVSNGTATDQAVLRVDVDAAPGSGPPVAVRDDVVVQANSPSVVDVTANDYDPAGNVLVVQSISVPSADNLTVEVLAHHILRVRTTAPLTAPVEFTYLESDGVAQADGTVVVTPAPSASVAQAPLTVPQTVTARAGSGTEVPVLEHDTDPQGQTLSIVGVTPLPAGEGALFVDGNELGYTAPATAPSSVTGTYTVADTGGNRSTGQVTIHLTGADGAGDQPPAPPVVVARTFAGDDVTVPIPLTGVDPDGDVVTLDGLVTPPGSGSIIASNADSFVYRPDKGATGTDHFTYQVQDRFGGIGTGTVDVAVVPPPTQSNGPTALPATAYVKAGSTVAINVLASDSDPAGSPLSLVTGNGALTQPKIGTATVEGTEIDYSAPAGTANTAVSFEYTIVDGLGNQAISSVTAVITNDPPPEPPVANDDLVDPKPSGIDVVVDVRPKTSDPTGSVDDLKVSVPPGSPAVVEADQDVRFPMPDGPAVVQYKVTDPAGLSATALIEVPLAGPADPVLPFIITKAVAGRPVTVAVLAKATDPDHRTLSLKGIAAQRHGAATIKGDAVVYTPDASYAGDAGFSYTVSDGPNSAVGSVLVQVTAAPHPKKPPASATTTTTVPGSPGATTAPTTPVAPVTSTTKPADKPIEFSAPSIQIAAGGSQTVDLSNATNDPNSGAKLSFGGLSGSTASIHASLSGSTLTVNADQDAGGSTASLAVTISDGLPGTGVTGHITVTVTSSAAPPPQAINDAATTDQGQAVTIDVLANDIDPLGKGLTVLSVGSSSAGTTTISNNKVVFTPNASYSGSANFTYKIGDASNDASRDATGTVTVTVIGQPDAPSAPSGTIANASVVLTWGIPTSNGAPIDYYTVKSSTGASTQCPSNTCTITGLTDGTGYTFTVAAHNAAGTGAYSSPSPSLTPNAEPSVPEAPAGTPGNGTVSLSWPAPADQGTSITGYTLAISPAPSSGASTEQVTGTSYKWSGLTNGTGYTFTVAATNSAGTTSAGPASAALIPFGNPLTPGKPTAVSMPGSGTATVSWTAPGDNGSAITGYSVGVSQNGATSPAVSAGAGATSTTVDVTNGDSYTFTVTATNAAGPSAASIPSDSVTPAGVPSAVAGVTASPGDGQASLSFSPPAANGSTITGYNVSVNGGAPQPLSGQTVTGLSNGTTYTFAVQACNAIGCGALSPASGGVIPYGAPAAPSVNASVNGTTITWNWDTPDGNGYPVTGYNVALNGGPVTPSGNSYSANVGYSQNTYTLTVVAVTSAPNDNTSAAGSASAGPIYETLTVDAIPAFGACSPSGTPAFCGGSANPQASTAFNQGNEGAPIGQGTQVQAYCTTQGTSTTAPGSGDVSSTWIKIAGYGGTPWMNSMYLGAGAPDPGNSFGLPQC